MHVYRFGLHCLALLVITVGGSSFAAADCCSGARCVHETVEIVTLPRHGRWHIIETENFQICCQDSCAPCIPLAQHAEALRQELASQWLATDVHPAWQPKCQILLYADQHDYVRAVGRGSERTVGSSLVKNSGTKISSRRIDLRRSAGDFLSAALPHELTHVVLRDRFPLAVPRWADEGMALLADPDAKLERHAHELRDALRKQSTFHTAELLQSDGYPSAQRWGAFYGQSMALTRFLVDRKTPADFVAFLELAVARGYDVALRHCYGIANVHELNRHWQTLSTTH